MIGQVVTIKITNKNDSIENLILRNRKAEESGTQEIMMKKKNLMTAVVLIVEVVDLAVAADLAVAVVHVFHQVAAKRDVLNAVVALVRDT